MAETEPVTPTRADYPLEVTDLLSARAFLIEARDIHQRWVDCIEHQLCATPTCTRCREYEAWLTRCLETVGDADWHRRWVRNYDVILAALPELAA